MANGESQASYLTSGQMAEANGVSRKALRVYREKGILEPHHVDPDSDRTFYDIRQSKKLDLVARLQGMGMSLDEIKAILDARDVEVLRESLERRVDALDEQIAILRQVRQDARNAVQRCVLYRNPPLVDQIMIEQVAEQRILSFPAPDLSAHGLVPDSAQEWEWVVRSVKRELRDAGLPPSLFREINGMRSYGPEAYEADPHAVPRRDRVFVLVDEVYGDIWGRAEVIPAGQQLVLYQDRGYDENGICVSGASIARMLDYMAAKHLVPCGAVREEVLFRFSHLLETDDGAILSRVCIPVASHRAG